MNRLVDACIVEQRFFYLMVRFFALPLAEDKAADIGDGVITQQNGRRVRLPCWWIRYGSMVPRRRMFDSLDDLELWIASHEPKQTEASPTIGAGRPRALQ